MAALRRAALLSAAHRRRHGRTKMACWVGEHSQACVWQHGLRQESSHGTIPAATTLAARRRHARRASHAWRRRHLPPQHLLRLNVGHSHCCTTLVSCRFSIESQRGAHHGASTGDCERPAAVLDGQQQACVIPQPQDGSAVSAGARNFE